MSLDFDLCLRKLREMQAQAAPDEDLIRFTRQARASMLESVKLIKEIKRISLREAQDLVHFSETWADYRENQEILQEDFFEALDAFRSMPEND